MTAEQLQGFPSSPHKLASAKSTEAPAWDALGIPVPRTPCVASGWRLPLHVGLSSPRSTPMSLFNTGLAPRDAEARAPLLLLGAGGDELRAGVALSLLTYDGLFPSLLQLAPVPAPALTLLAVLTPVREGQEVSLGLGELLGKLQTSLRS